MQAEAGTDDLREASPVEVAEPDPFESETIRSLVPHALLRKPSCDLLGDLKAVLSDKEHARLVKAQEAEKERESMFAFMAIGSEQAAKFQNSVGKLLAKGEKKASNKVILKVASLFAGRGPVVGSPDQASTKSAVELGPSVADLIHLREINEDVVKPAQLVAMYDCLWKFIGTAVRRVGLAEFAYCAETVMVHDEDACLKAIYASAHSFYTTTGEIGEITHELFPLEVPATDATANAAAPTGTTINAMLTAIKEKGSGKGAGPAVAASASTQPVLPRWQQILRLPSAQRSFPDVLHLASLLYRLHNRILEMLTFVPMVELARHARIEQFKQGDKVFVENGPGDRLYLLLHGNLLVLKRIQWDPSFATMDDDTRRVVYGPDVRADEQRVVSALGEGSIFGERAVFSGSARAASIEVQSEHATCLSWTVHDWHTPFRLEFRRQLAEKINFFLMMDLFSLVTPVHLCRFCVAVKERRFAAGHIVSQIGDAAVSVYWAYKGQLSVKVE